MYSKKIWTSEAIGAGEDATTEQIDANAYAKQGYVSIQYEITGSGVGKLEALLSNDGAGYITKRTIVSGLIETSGPGGDGKDIVRVYLEPCEKFKIKVTETGAADAIAISATVSIR